MSMWYGLPMVRVEDLLDMQNRIKALESWCNTLETLLLEHRRRHPAPHHSLVPRETSEDFDAIPSLYYQTLIDLAPTAPEGDLPAGERDLPEPGRRDRGPGDN